jgi:hypothetical protein
MIVLTTVKERDKRTGELVVIASHGTDTKTGKNVIVSLDPPGDLGAMLNKYLRWVILSPEEIADPMLAQKGHEQSRLVERSDLIIS